MPGFAGDILPKSFNCEYEEGKKQVHVKLEFSIDNEEETELELVGQLHRSEKGELGIEWVKGEGNDFWLTAVENSLNGSI